ncbi:zinc-dependent metalloprotease [Corynebacterium ulceribovis]|uniref:zinc-dependent metalloprotease n=1 Tax=Corynebacterium ulceribovis TaxID=487732 RepID=UPI000370F410|nr:zinc-dependent metalloprotease [Corynebacterium ulceribovis]
MSSGGFGFQGGNGGRDDDRDDNNRDNNDPFAAFGFGPLFGMGPGPGGAGAGGPGAGGAGGLGDILSQFGQMLSGFGASMNNPEPGSPVNFALTERIARQQIGRPEKVSDNTDRAVGDAIRLTELWLDDATVLPVGANRVESWNSSMWLDNTLPTWKRFVVPVAERMNEASLEQLPEEARAQMGPMLDMMNSMSAMNFGMQIGHALGSLAKDAVTSSDFGLPLANTGAAAVLPSRINDLAKQLEVPAQELIMYLAAREAAHQRLFAHIPWLAERLISSVEEYAAGLSIDYSAMEEATRALNLESMEDPAQLQEAMEQLQNMDMSPQIHSANVHAKERLQTLLALVEGWVDVVVMDALRERLPKAQAIHESWVRRRATGGSAEEAFEKVVGVQLGSPRVADAVDLWRRLDDAVGQQRRDQVWDHPDFIPVAADLDNSAAFIDSVLGGSVDDDFDPIAELQKQLEKEAREGDNREFPKGRSKDDES